MGQIVDEAIGITAEIREKTELDQMVELMTEPLHSEYGVLIQSLDVSCDGVIAQINVITVSGQSFRFEVTAKDTRAKMRRQSKELANARTALLEIQHVLTSTGLFRD